jgi:hypothetical protein
MQAYRPLRVAWRVDHLRGECCETNDAAVSKRLVGRSGLRRFDTDPCGLFVHELELFEVTLVHEDGRSGQALEFERTAYVVNMSVGDEDLLELEAQVCQTPLDSSDFLARIDDDGLAGLLVAENGAVALKRANGEGLDDHAVILLRTGDRRKSG